MRHPRRRGSAPWTRNHQLIVFIVSSFLLVSRAKTTLCHFLRRILGKKSLAYRNFWRFMLSRRTGCSMPEQRKTSRPFMCSIWYLQDPSVAPHFEISLLISCRLSTPTSESISQNAPNKISIVCYSTATNIRQTILIRLTERSVLWADYYSHVKNKRIKAQISNSTITKTINILKKYLLSFWEFYLVYNHSCLSYFCTILAHNGCFFHLWFT